MGQISENAKIKNKEKWDRDQKIVKILRIMVYALTVILAATIGTWFIMGAMMGHHNIFTNDIAIPVALILFGAIDICLTQINPRLSRTSNVKGDKLMLVIGALLVAAGIIYLIYNLVA